jgi:hypothetical protein
VQPAPGQDRDGHPGQDQAHQGVHLRVPDLDGLTPGEERA